MCCPVKNNYIMDPTIWGPKLWNIIFDICWAIDRNNTSKIQQQSVTIFFESLQYLLPCKYCRMSYVQYLRDLKGPPKSGSGNALRWAYTLRNKVNNKLKRKYKLTFEKFERRMKTYQSMSSQNVLKFTDTRKHGFGL